MTPPLQNVLRIIGFIVNYNWAIYYNEDDIEFFVPQRFDKIHNELRFYIKGVLEEYPISINNIFIINKYIITNKGDHYTDVQFSFKDVTIKSVFYKNIMPNINKL